MGISRVKAISALLVALAWAAPGISATNYDGEIADHVVVPCLEARVKKLTNRDTFTIREVVSIIQRIDMRVPERAVVIARAIVNGGNALLAERMEYYAMALKLCKETEIES